MGSYEQRLWPGNDAAPTQRERREGPYRVFIPDELSQLPLTLGPELSSRINRLERRLRGFTVSPDTIGMEALSRLLQRGEAVASSYIEGLRVSSKKLVQLQVERELGGVNGFTGGAAAQVVANLDIIETAVRDLAAKPWLAVEDVVALQQQLVAADRQAGLPQVGLRRFQNWVGGSQYHPLDAEYVPPPPEYVVGLLEDLMSYASGATHSALVQSALVHAQFETIHPFADGNGRVGRALIHLIWRARGLETVAALPLSAALATRSGEYVRGLTAFRGSDEVGSAAWRNGIEQWLNVFCDAAEAALQIATDFAADIAHKREDWKQLHQNYFVNTAKRGLRRDSTAVRLREDLPAYPMFTTGQVCRRLDVSKTAAERACKLLHDLDIIQPLSIAKGIRGWYAPDIFDVLNVYERKVASSQWNTASKAPWRPAPDRRAAR